MIAGLGLAFLFPTRATLPPGGSAVAGVLELLLVWADARRNGLAPKPAIPRFDKAMVHFFRPSAPP